MRGAPCAHPPPTSLASVTTPLLLPGYVSDWPAVRDWATPAALASALASAAPPSTPLDALAGCARGAAGAARYEAMTLADFAAEVGRGRAALYLAQAPVGPGTPLARLCASAAPPPPLAPSSAAPVLWVSAGRAESSTHYDCYHGLLCVAAGLKTVRLAPPTAAAALAARPPAGDAANHADGDAFEGVTGAVVARLSPGDALFVPEGWWHGAASSPASAALTFWWPSPTVAALDAAPDSAPYLLRLGAARLAEGSDSEPEEAGTAYAGPLAAVAAAAAPLPTLTAAAVADPAAVAAEVARLPPRVADRLAGALDCADAGTLAALAAALGPRGDGVMTALLEGRQKACLERLARRVGRVLGGGAAVRFLD